jgi:hypothetical protein
MNVDGKMIPVEIIPGVGGGVKENNGWMNLSMIYLIYCKNICKFTMEPHPAQQLKNKTFLNQSL